MQSPVIIPVAGGKGGIGKSLLAANMSVALAKMGNRVIAMDLDLGASNMHILMGLRNSGRNVLRFASNADIELDDMVVDSGFEGLGVICGAPNIAGASNLSNRQKMRILRSIDYLPCEYVVLDLGAGSSFLVTDFFLTGGNGIVVIVPEITSLLDAYAMLKSALHRKLQNEFLDTPEVSELVESFRDPANDRHLVTVDQLISEVTDVNASEGSRMRWLVEGFEVRVVMNRIRTQKDFHVLRTLQDLAIRNLSLKVVHVGYLPEDKAVGRSVNCMIPFVHAAPQSRAAIQLFEITRRLASQSLLAANQ